MLFANAKTRHFIVQGKHRSREVEPAFIGEVIIDCFLVWFSVSFFFSHTVVSRLCAATGSSPPPPPFVYRIAKVPILLGATLWMGRHPRFRQLLLQVSLVACCELANPCIFCSHWCHYLVVCFDCKKSIVNVAIIETCCSFCNLRRVRSISTVVVIVDLCLVQWFILSRSMVPVFSSQPLLAVVAWAELFLYLVRFISVEVNTVNMCAAGYEVNCGCCCYYG